ncbi:acyltransferase [Egicoccus sp. AB-alg6-2]|uniref:acyltransferase family protein n=1 Tax=Egicoccus sp. AB-alg6-2 TaxID=3242692 RepID=UPI00359EBA6D
MATAVLAAPATTTTGDRDRVVDLVRAVSLLVVAFGHWLLAGVWMDSAGGVQVDHLLAAAPWTRWVTWAAQVIGLFMLAGAYANATSWRNHTARGGGYGGWLTGRFLRLLGPTLPFVAFWVPTAWVLGRAGLVEPAVLRQATQVVAVPVWFLAVYVLLVAATPALLAWHDRAGVRVLAAIVAAAVVVEVVSRGLGVEVVGWLQFPLVWGAVHQFGFFWQDGRLRAAGRRTWVALAVVGFGGLLLVTSVLDLYPVSMVGVPGEVRSNNTPPSLAIVLLACAHLGVLMLAHARLTSWLARPTVWRATGRLGAMSMSVYLWHLSVMVAVLGAAVVLPGGARLLSAPANSPTWWATRPGWLLTYTVVTLLVVRLVLPVERATVAAVARLRGCQVDARRPVLATLLACGAMAAFAGRGFTVVDRPAGIPVEAVVALGAAGSLVAGALRSADRHPH